MQNYKALILLFIFSLSAVSCFEDNDDIGVTENVKMKSSLKFCVIAEGKADIYPRFSPTMEWDTAAGHAVLSGAGGKEQRAACILLVACAQALL